MGNSQACKHENFDSELMKYCPDCGAAITVCPNSDCEASVDIDWTYCPYCGRSLKD